jgi:hypothetical protein
MKISSETEINRDFFVSCLRTQINILSKLLDHIENDNPIDHYVDENLRNVKKELRWMLISCFSN